MFINKIEDHTINALADSITKQLGGDPAGISAVKRGIKGYDRILVHRAGEAERMRL